MHPLAWVPSLLAASDVLGIGWFGAVAADFAQARRSQSWATARARGHLSQGQGDREHLEIKVDELDSGYGVMQPRTRAVGAA